jgi:oxygen-independent coproporphyrinogen-3 oxidase
MRRKTPPLSLYVHLPWCVQKCPYCDFNSHTAGNNAPRGRYLEALLIDLQSEAASVTGRPLISIFFGGGTPSLFSPDEIARLLEAIDRHFPLADDIEVTMEANPGTVECGKCSGYFRAGVNRLSIGAQSFDDASLAMLGRIHASGDIARVVAEAQDAGFDNINLDLMYALPRQDVGAALNDIEAAVQLKPTHISWYQLTLEPNTVFHARPPDGLPDDELSYEIQNRGQELLHERGFKQYEVSAYARNGYSCVHNLNYWSFGDYVAVGAGAHGKISSRNAVCRYAKAMHPQQYMASMEHGIPNGTPQSLADRDLLFEFMINALRLNAGFDERLFEARTGLSRAALRQRLRAPLQKGLIAPAADNVWRPTPMGRRFLNDLQADFLPE